MPASGTGFSEWPTTGPGIVIQLPWYQALAECQQSGQPWVLATVLHTQGSTPRGSGSKMLVTADRTYDSLGGGQLEYQVQAHARELLAAGVSCQRVEHFPLSSKSRQCCGGSVTVLLECQAVKSLQIHLFGAGHVAQALVTILAGLAVRVQWVDSRAEQFPTQLPGNIHKVCQPRLTDHVARLSPGDYALVLTHDHALDYQLIEALLDRKDCGFIGLIGSKTKALRFAKRLRTASFSEAAIAAVHCPVGLPAVPGKRPMEVAVSIAAQIIQRSHTGQTLETRGVRWQDMPQNLLREDS